MNLHLPLLLWGGHIQTIYQFQRLRMYLCVSGQIGMAGSSILWWPESYREEKNIFSIMWCISKLTWTLSSLIVILQNKGNFLGCGIHMTWFLDVTLKETWVRLNSVVLFGHPKTTAQQRRLDPRNTHLDDFSVAVPPVPRELIARTLFRSTSQQ